MLKQAWTSSEGYNPLKMVKKHPKYWKNVTIEKYDEIVLQIVYFIQVYSCSIKSILVFSLIVVQNDPKLD